MSWGHVKPALNRRVGEIRPGSETISKVEWGNTETQESLTPPTKKRLIRMDRAKTIQVNRVHIATPIHAKKRRYRRVSNSEGNRRRREGQGSLSILIVLFEGW